MRLTRREWHQYGIAGAVVGLGSSVARFQGALAKDNALEPSEETWLGLKGEIFGDAEIADGTGLLALETPSRAEDAAIVPVTLRTSLAAGDPRTIEQLTIVVDENPAPLAARFSFGANSGIAMVATRVRVDTYSYIHAVAKLSDGKIYMIKNFVKATGGCSAPAAKNADAASATIGQLKLRQFGQSSTDAVGNSAEAQVQVRHPNYSGMQMDQITRLYIPAYFVDSLKIFRDNDFLLSMEGGISISENPTVRFNYAPQGANRLRVEARDTSGGIFTQSWPIETGAM
jgi:sulfur-oxidizing protein SoxY